MHTIEICQTDFLDILFDGRNKDYGAYDLRRRYDGRVRNAIIGTASLALLLMGGYVISNRLTAADMHIRSEMPKDPVILKPLSPVEIEKPPVMPPPPAHSTPPPPARSTIRLATPVIDKDENVRPEDEPPKLADAADKTISVSNTMGDDINGADIGVLNSPGTSGVIEPPKAEDRDRVFITVEIMPSFPGGQAALFRYLQDNIRYPQMAAENDIQGTIYVQFVVDARGNITNVQTTGARKGGGLEEEAMRVVRKMPKWKPGRQNGQYVNVQFNLPINFQMH